MSELERIYTVPLKEAWNAQRYRRSEKAMMVLKAFAVRHMKASTVTVDNAVNEAVWARGIKSPPHKIRVKMTKDDEGAVTITLAEVDARADAKAEAKKARTEAKEAKKPKAKKDEPKAEAEKEAKVAEKPVPEAEPAAEAEKKE